MTSLLDLLPSGPDRHGRIEGVVTGVVTNNKDPDGHGRVKLKFPWLSDQEESWWARVAAPMAGKERGFYFLPEVDDEVLVAFEHGDPRFPYVIGALWNSQAKPPLTNTDGKNNVRAIKSRSGHTVTLDDTQGEEKILIVDKSKKNSIAISTKDNTITITADSDIVIESKSGKVKITGKSIELASQTTVKVESKSATNLEAQGQMTVKGSTVSIN